MSIAKFPKKETINIVVCNDSDVHLHRNVKGYTPPKGIDDCPVLTVTKEDGNLVIYNWLTTSYVEVVTDEEANEMEEDEVTEEDLKNAREVLDLEEED